MKISYEDHGPVALVIASGEFVADAAERFRRTVGERLAAGARSVVIDLANVARIDSSGLEDLLWLSGEVSAAGGALRLAAPPFAVTEALRVTRLADRFVVAESVELAARSLR